MFGNFLNSTQKFSTKLIKIINKDLKKHIFRVVETPPSGGWTTLNQFTPQGWISFFQVAVGGGSTTYK
jgi:hypothetical protein